VRDAEDMPGWSVPLHRSLTEPILVGGIPRGIAIALATLAAAIGLGLQLWLAGIAVYVLGHGVALFLTRQDPQFLAVFARHLRAARHHLDV
jgi:type IV secretory pathway TrbD component